MVISYAKFNDNNYVGWIIVVRGSEILCQFELSVFYYDLFYGTRCHCFILSLIQFI